jgi:hypothetical protein
VVKRSSRWIWRRIEEEDWDLESVYTGIFSMDLEKDSGGRLGIWGGFTRGSVCRESEVEGSRVICGGMWRTSLIIEIIR